MEEALARAMPPPSDCTAAAAAAAVPVAVAVAVKGKGRAKGRRGATVSTRRYLKDTSAGERLVVLLLLLPL